MGEKERTQHAEKDPIVIPEVRTTPNPFATEWRQSEYRRKHPDRGIGAIVKRGQRGKRAR